MINQKYFESIDSEEKAYFLGLIFADGNVMDSRLTLLLAEEDSKVLDILLKNIKPDGRINFLDRKNPKWKNCRIFSIHNKEIVKDLNGWGVLQRKRYTTLSIPNIDHSLIRHFIRGFMDGDGFISYRGYYSHRKNGWKNYTFRKVIGFTNSSKEFLVEISNFLSEELGIDKGKFYNTNGTGSTINSYSLWFFRNNDLIKLIDYLYKDATIFFERKFENAKICKLTPREFRELTNFEPCNA